MAAVRSDYKFRVANRKISFTPVPIKTFMAAKLPKFRTKLMCLTMVHNVLIFFCIKSNAPPCELGTLYPFCNGTCCGSERKKFEVEQRRFRAKLLGLLVLNTYYTVRFNFGLVYTYFGFVTWKTCFNINLLWLYLDQFPIRVLCLKIPGFL